MIRRAWRGLAGALRSRPRVFLGVAAAVVALDVFLPPIVLSIARKPVDYFTWNAWLGKVPEYVRADPSPVAVKLDKLWNLALFWFSSDNPYGVEWGFAVTVADLARFLLMAAILGAYFALWLHRRDVVAAAGWAAAGSPNAAGGSVRRAAFRGGGPSGVLGVASSVLGVTTGGCTVMGCGAPVLPVVGLAFAGLSSTTLKWLAGLSVAATWFVLVGMSLGALYLAWRAGGTPTPSREL